MKKEDKQELNKLYGKNNWRIKLGHGGVETLYVQKGGHFVFESYEYNRVLKSKDNELLHNKN